MDGASIYSPPKVGFGGYCRYRQLEAGNLAVLNFHAKPQPERPPSGAGRPPLGRPAWGCRHVAAVFRTTALIPSWSRLTIGLVPVL